MMQLSYFDIQYYNHFCDVWGDFYKMFFYVIIFLFIYSTQNLRRG